MAVKTHGVIWQPTLCPAEVVSRGLGRQLEDVDRRDTAAYHNAFMEYSLALMLFATGHRPVQDPFCLRHQLDEISGLALVDDKVSNERRRYRLAYLPDIAKQQVVHYIHHLRNLSLSERALPGSELRMAISEMLSLDTKQRLPLFFYLGDNNIELVDHARIEQMYRRLAPFPGNIHRKWLATCLAGQQVPAWLIASTMGHMESNILPNGDFCRESPLEIRGRLNEYLNPKLVAAGWDAVASAYRPQYASRQCPVESVRLTRPMGELYRRRLREQKRTKAKSLVKNFIVELGDAPAPQENELEQWVDENYRRLIELLEQNHLPVKDPLRWFQRYLAVYGTAVLGTKGRLWSREEQAESSHWRGTDLLVYRQAVSARSVFLDVLEKQARENRGEGTEARQLRAMSVVSVALLSCMASSEDLQAVLKGQYALVALNNSYGLQTGSTQINCDHPVVPLDSVSAALIGKLGGDSATGAPPSSALANLLNAIGVKKDTKDIKQLCDNLSEQGRAFLSIEASGLYRACHTGRLKTTPLDLSTLSRLCYDKPLSLVHGTHGGPQVIFEPQLNAYTEGKPQGDLKDLLSRLYKAMSEEGQAAYISREKQKNSKRSFSHNHLSRQQKRDYLEALLRKQLREHALPILGQLMVHWGIHLCQHKTRHNNIVEAETILKYLSLVANKLAQIAGEAVLYFEPEDWEDAYLKAIDGSALAAMRNLTARLYDFHYYLTSFWRVAVLDWSQMFALAGLKDEAGQVDANVITSNEYLRLIDFIDSDGNRQNLELQFCGWMLMLGYRFGLRWSEALYLKMHDLVLEQGELRYVRVRGNEYRKLKTTASQRTLPLLESMTPVEKEILGRVVNQKLRTTPIGETSNLLVCDNPYTGERFDEVSLSQICSSLLKQVTGDQRLRYHHLRHSYACRHWVKLACNATNDANTPRLISAFLSSEQVPQHISPYRNDGILALRSVSDLLGHASMATTVHSYLHLVQWVSPALSHDHLPKLSNAVLGFLLDQTEGAVRKKRQRYGSKRSWQWLMIEMVGKYQGPSIELGAESVLRLSEYHIDRSQTFSPRLVHTVLTDYATHDRCIELTARRLSLVEQEVLSWIKRGEAIERLSGYERFRLQRSIPAAGQSEFASKPEWVRVDDVLKRVDADHSIREKVRNAAAIWAEAYHPSTGEYFFTCYEDLFTFLGALKALGVEVREASFMLKGSFPREQEKIGALKALGLKEASGSYFYQRQVKGRIYRKIALVLSIKKLSGTLVRKRQVNRLMFVSSCLDSSS